MRLLVIFMITGIAYFMGTEVVCGQYADISGVPKKTYHWFGGDTAQLVQKAKPITLHPPVFGKKRRNNGMILPLPFGGGLNFFKFDQYYTATELQLDNFENNIVIKAETVDDNTESGEMSITVRPDVWLFPFLNFYGLFGYTTGYTNYDITVNNFSVIDDDGNDLSIDSSFNLKANPEYSGAVYGFGTTVSTGFKGYFVLLNYEYSKTNRDDYDEKLEYQYFRAKTGILLGRNEKKAKGAFWLGTSFMHDKHSFKGLIPTQDVLPGNEWILGEVLTYSGVDQITNSWNFLFGGSFNINDHQIFVVEVGVLKRKHLNLSYTYRF